MKSFDFRYVGVLVILHFICLSSTNLVFANPPIGSPEDIQALPPCLDADGKPIPSHPVCGCGPINSCGMCSSNEDLCNKCQLKDCKGVLIPNSESFCHLDVNNDSSINSKDDRLITDQINSKGKDLRYDTNRDGILSAIDSLLVKNFINSPEAGAVEDECGVCEGPGDLGCGCNNPPPSGCDKRCGSLKVEDECGVCGGDGTSCAQQCRYITASINDRGEDHSRLHENIFATYGNLKSTCINGLISQVISNAKTWDKGLLNWNDDSYAITLANMIFPDRDRSGRTIEGVHSNGAICHRRYRSNVPGGHGMCANGSFLLDAKTCQVISHPDGQLCGNFELNFYSGCPVALNWTEKSETPEDSEIVKFNLALDKQKWALWKGSADFPLLVFDPSHNGNITSATQLFGEWTFGGKLAASLTNLENEHQLSPKPWKNGYEALASLDQDKNGKVDGEELKDLALWFDSNKDAISQEGEVKRVSELGVQSLFYTPDSKDKTGDIRISKGFERMIGSNKIEGSSIDWYTKISDSPMSLIQLSQLNAYVNDLSLQEESLIDSPPKKALKKPTGKFSGIWKWDMKSPTNQELFFGGYLLVSTLSDEGEIVAISLAEHKLAKTFSPDVSSGAQIITFTAEEIEENGILKLKFSSKDGGKTLETEAQISEDGSTLEGITKASGVVNGDKVNFNYKWVGTKFK